jgi:hypothetical protein
MTSMTAPVLRQARWGRVARLAGPKITLEAFVLMALGSAAGLVLG